MAKHKKDKTLTEKYLLEEAFSKPIVLWTYKGGVPIKKKIDVFQYDLRIDRSRILKKLEVLFAFPYEKYADIKQGVVLNKKIEAQRLKPIVKTKDRPVVLEHSEYVRGTGRNVRITLRTGHILTGEQVYATKFNIILSILDITVLVYKHGIHAYQIEGVEKGATGAV